MERFGFYHVISEAVLAFRGRFLAILRQSVLLVTSVFFLVLIYYGRSRSTSSPSLRVTALDAASDGEYVSTFFYHK